MASDKEVLEQFRKHGIQASYHYADDSGKEWAQGTVERDRALQLWREHPELTEQMLGVSKSFLWSFSHIVENQK